MSSEIYFLNTGASDCIVLYSNGSVAMIDAAEDTEFPSNRPWLNYPGYEDKVVDFLIQNFMGDDGFVTLDFILGTHCHSDHIGGFDTVILNDKIKIKKAYLKPYVPENIFILETKTWDNDIVYKQMVDALNKKSVPIIDSFDNEKISLGDMNITFFNGAYKKPRLKFGDNVHSVVTLVECNGNRVLLCGDMNYKNGGEKSLAPKIGKVDAIKVGHHGYVFSTSFRWVKTLDPDIAVVPNKSSKIYPDVRFKLEKIAKAKIYATVDCNGVKLDLTENQIKVKTNI